MRADCVSVRRGIGIRHVESVNRRATFRVWGGCANQTTFRRTVLGYFKVINRVGHIVGCGIGAWSYEAEEGSCN